MIFGSRLSPLGWRPPSYIHLSERYYSGNVVRGSGKMDLISPCKKNPDLCVDIVSVSARK